jgi:lipopolysaccharide/colanic/teichoic acid biosynthesis glycosyltransferase
MAFKKKHSGRKLRNFLLNKKLQLSFALFMLGVTATLTAVLITVIVYQTNKSTEMFVRQRKEATKMFVRQRREASKMFNRQRREATRIMKQQLKVATDMLKVMEEDEELRDAVMAARQDLKKRDAERIKTRRRQDEEMRKRRQHEDEQMRKRREKEDAEIAAEQRQNMIILIASMIGFSVMFLVVLFLYGIVLTHKVAGPLFKITRHMDEVRDGQLKKIWGLRKGDQLIEFFNHFKEMHDELKKRIGEDILVLQTIKDNLSATEEPNNRKALEQIELLIEKKSEQLEDAPPQKAVDSSNTTEETATTDNQDETTDETTDDEQEETESPSSSA